MAYESHPPSAFLNVMKDIYSALRSIKSPKVYWLGDARARSLANACMGEVLESRDFRGNDSGGFDKNELDFRDKYKLDNIFSSRYDELIRTAYEFGKYCSLTNTDLVDCVECMWPEIEKMEATVETDDSKKADLWDEPGKRIFRPIRYYSSIYDDLYRYVRHSN